MLRIDTIALSSPNATAAAWANGHLFIVDSERALWLDDKRLVQLERSPRALALSPSGEQAAALLSDPLALIWWTEVAAPVDIAHVLSSEPRDLAFVRHAREEVLAIALKHEVVLVRGGGEIVARQSLGSFAVSSIRSVLEGHSIAILGQEFGESRDTLVLLGAEELPIESSAFGRRFHFTEGLVDSAAVLSIGPGGSDRVVVFRDTGDAEEPLDDDEVNAVVPREWGFRGFYVALPNGETVGRIASLLPVDRGAGLAASERFIACAAHDSINVVRRDTGEVERLDLRWASTTPTGDRILAFAPDGTLRLIDLSHPSTDRSPGDQNCDR